MNTSFKYGISIQEAIKDMCEEAGESERIEFRKLAEVFLLRKDIRLTAFKEESGLDRDVDIDASQAATALFAICEYPVTDYPDGYSLESHFVMTGRKNQGDYIEVPIKYFRISRSLLTDMLKTAEIFPIPKKWMEKTERPSHDVTVCANNAIQPASGEQHQEVKREIRTQRPGDLRVTVDEINQKVVVFTQNGKKTIYTRTDMVGKGTLTWDLLVDFAKCKGSLEGNTQADVKKRNTSGTRGNLGIKLKEALGLDKSPFVKGRNGVMMFASIGIAGGKRSVDALDRKTVSLDEQATELLAGNGGDMPVFD